MNLVFGRVHEKFRLCCFFFVSPVSPVTAATTDNLQSPERPHEGKCESLHLKPSWFPPLGISRGENIIVPVEAYTMWPNPPNPAS